MDFIDILRGARQSHVAVLHEFWTQYDPQQKRLHLFVEGHDDVAFVVRAVEQRMLPGTRIYTYRCEGKGRVFDAFAKITDRKPDIRSTLFFVDKDLDDILGVPWPMDPRIYVTDVYSIENYAVTPTIVRRLLQNNVRLVGVKFDEDEILAHFDRQLRRFQRSCLPLMSWILAIRRAGGRPNLNNIDLGQLYTISDKCELRLSRGRLSRVMRAAGVSFSCRFSHLLQSTRHLRGMPPKRVVRGKFEMWFLVEFWKALLKQLAALSRESGGKLSVKGSLEHASAVTVLAPLADTPKSLDMFLRAHLGGEQPIEFSQEPTSRARRGWLRTTLSRIVGRWTASLS